MRYSLNQEPAVVNPNGGYGIKTRAFTITQAAQPPPVVTSIAPSSVVLATNANIAVLGQNFRSPSVAVVMLCMLAMRTKLYAKLHAGANAE